MVTNWLVAMVSWLVDLCEIRSIDFSSCLHSRSLLNNLVVFKHSMMTSCLLRYPQRVSSSKLEPNLRSKHLNWFRIITKQVSLQRALISLNRGAARLEDDVMSKHRFTWNCIENFKSIFCCYSDVSENKLKRINFTFERGSQLRSLYDLLDLPLQHPLIFHLLQSIWSMLTFIHSKCLPKIDRWDPFTVSLLQ